MKRFWLVLLALGMLFAFSTSVFAADVKFTGSFYVAGMYLDKNALPKDDAYAYSYNSLTGFDQWGNQVWTGGTVWGGRSTAFYYQRLRVQMEFIATPALKLVTRFDAMERIWGGPRSDAATYPVAADVGSAGTRTENQNIAFDWAYIQYVSKIGMFMVGYQQDGAWGTVFGDNSIPLAKIQYVIASGPVVAGIYAGKIFEGNHNAVEPRYAGDVDDDKYVAFVNYKVTKDIVVGLLGAYYRLASNRDWPNGVGYPAVNTYFGPFKADAYALLPYFKAKLGPVAIEGEVNYAWGTIDYEPVRVLDGATKVKIENISAYLDAVADLGMFYVGGTFAYIRGDKPTTAKKSEGGLLNGGIDWNPCLILFNQDMTYWHGPIYGGPYATAIGLYPTQMNSPMSNVWFYQGRVGVRPVADLDIRAALAYANADQKPGTALPVAKKDYGWELDVTASYAITNNLSYMLGVGYLWTGDYFKGGIPGYKVNDNYLVVNKLTLTF